MLFEIPGIPFERMPEVNRALKTLIDEVAAGVSIEQREGGYPASERAIFRPASAIASASLRITTQPHWQNALSGEVFPNHYHVKIALTGCPNDCIKAHLQDFGIIGQADVELDPQRCVGCEACAQNCQLRVTGAITMRNSRAVRDPRRCIGCGECVLKCPTNAWTRNPQKYYRLVIMGRTGKKNPRLAATFLEWTTEEALVAIIRNTYAFIDQHIDRSLPKEHVGYIVDRVGYQRFREAVLSGVELGAKAVIAENLIYATLLQTHTCQSLPGAELLSSK